MSISAPHRELFRRFSVVLTAAAVLFSAAAATAGKCANVQLVVERASSMSTTMDFFTRIGAVKSVVGVVLPLYAQRYGLTGYPATAAACDYDTAVLPATLNATNVTTALNAYTALGSSSTGSAIHSVASLSDYRDASRQQFMLLITDGARGCAGSSADTTAGTVDEIRKAYAQTPPIPTLVIGLGTLSAADSDAINQMAVAGGRPLTGTTQYYAAPTSFDLLSVVSSALTAIDTEVGACSDTPGDMGGPSDMAGPVDLSVPHDLSAPRDLSGPVDLSLPRDLSLPDDLSLPLDLSGPHDLLSSIDLRSAPVDLLDVDLFGVDLTSGDQNTAPIVDWIDPSMLEFGLGGAATVIGRHFVFASPSSVVFLSSGTNLIALSNALVTDGFHIEVALPSDLPVGVYDVVVKNPDGQIGTQPHALTIVDKAHGCSCSIGSHEPPSAPPGLIAFALLLGLALFARSQPGRARRAI